MVGIRVAPDDNDIVVWKMDEAAAPFVNSSTSPSAISNAISDLATLSGDVKLQQPSLFSASGQNTCVQFTSTNSNSPRNFISGANNLEPQGPVTFSFWILLRQYNVTGFTQHWLSKQHTAGVWSGVFAQVGFGNRQHVSQPQALDFFAVTATGGGNVIPSEYTIPLYAWCHVGLVYDGSTQKSYINGVLVGNTAATGAINYGNHGPWFMGAIPSGSGNPEECAVSICDIRIANIARPQSYFKNIYQNGVLPSNQSSSGTGSPVTTFYKLRAYDLACATPSPVYWVSNKIDYAGAVGIPCGSSSTLGPIEIVETWNKLGLPTPSDSITSALNGLLWLLPNVGNVSSTVCTAIPSVSTFTTLVGDASSVYNVTLRFRGVVETKAYTGGTNDGAFFQTGGTPVADNWNIYQLTISNPPQTYYLNRGTSGLSNTFSMDYTKTLQMAGGATVTLTANSLDNQEIKNQDGSGNNPQSIPGITYPAQPFDGQFIRMDVISVT